MGKACANSVLGDDVSVCFILILLGCRFCPYIPQDLSFWLTNIHFVCRGDVHNTTSTYNIYLWLLTDVNLLLPYKYHNC